MTTEKVTLNELAGSRAQRALDLEAKLDELEPGTDQYEKVVKAQSVMYSDVKDMLKVAADEESDRRRNKTALIKAGIGALGVAGGAFLRWLFWKQDIDENKKGNYQDRDVKTGASEIEKSIKEGLDRVKSEFN